MISAKYTILGSGPAGLAAAERLQAARQDLAWVSPDLGTPWPHFLGMWLDEAEELGLEPHLANRWAEVEVRFSPDSHVTLDRTYARLDNGSLYREWFRPFQEDDRALYRCSAVAVEQREKHLLVTLSDGRQIQTEFVLDARGTGNAVPAGSSGPALAQSAYGIVLRSSAKQLSQTRATLMDFSSIPQRDTGAPTFLYALPLGDDTFLLEETSLAHAPALSKKELAERLWARLNARGISGDVLDEEHVHIPLVCPLPPRSGPCIALGAAAALINPMSGYSLPAGIAHARDCIEVILQGVKAGKSASTLRHEVWQRTWSPERRLERKIRLFGIDVLTHLNLPDTQSFLQSLFLVNPNSWKILLGHRTRPAELVAAMQATFRALPFPLQIKAGFGISRHLDLLVHLSRYRFGIASPAAQELR